jgi:hypothetical protein
MPQASLAPKEMPSAPSKMIAPVSFRSQMYLWKTGRQGSLRTPAVRRCPLYAWYMAPT